MRVGRFYKFNNYDFREQLFRMVKIMYHFFESFPVRKFNTYYILIMYLILKNKKINNLKKSDLHFPIFTFITSLF